MVIVNNNAMYTRVWMDLSCADFISFEYISSCGIAESYDMKIFEESLYYFI